MIEKYTQKNNSQKGFTLVELIVVLLIITILASIAVPTFLYFIDAGKEKEHKANASKSLAATRTALSDLYSDASSSLTADKRKKARILAGVSEDTSFMVWTEAQLFAGRTKAIPENIASYTVDKALYGENGQFFFYDGEEWVKMASKSWDDAKSDAAQDNSKALYMWPYSDDSGFIDDDDPEDEDDISEDDIKVVVLHLDYVTNAFAKDKVYFSREEKEYDTGLESVRVLFWKENNEWKSTWEVKGAKDVYVQDETAYELHFVGNRFSFKTWRNAKDGQEIASADLMKVFIDANANVSNHFEFNLVLEDNGEIPEVDKVYISRDAFGNALGSYGIVNIQKVPSQGEAGIPSGAVKIDDGRNPDGYAYAWLEGSVLKWTSNALKVCMPEDCSGLCAGRNIRNADFTGFDFSETRTMKEMFAGCPNLETVSGITVGTNDTTGTEGILTDVGGMFKNCPVLTYADVSGLKGNILALNSMFEGCDLLSNYGMIAFSSEFNTSGVSDFSNMFKKNTGNSGSGETIDISAFDMSKASNLESMFENCGAEEIILPGGTTPSLTNLKNTFKNCTNLKSLDFTGWTMEKVSTMESTFEGLSSIESVNVGSGWNLSSCTTMNSAFKGCVNLNTLASEKIITSGKLTNLDFAFAGCCNLSEINLDRFFTSNVTSMKSMFSMDGYSSGTMSLETIGFGSTFDTSRVTDMSNLFYGCSELKTINGIDKFRTVNVKNMSGMFAGNTELETLDLSSFETAGVSRFDNMFADTTLLKTIWASPRFVIASSNESQNVFDNNTLLTGGRGTKIEDCQISDSENFDTLKYANVDGWEGERGYFTGKFREVYVAKDKFSGMFSYHASKIVHEPTSKYSIAELQYENKKDFTSIKDTKGNKNTYYYIFAWREGDNFEEIHWWTDADVAYFPEDSSSMLANVSLDSFDFSGFDVTKVTKFNKLFSGDAGLRSVEFGNMFYADKCTNMTEMFAGCGLTDIDMSGMRFKNINLTRIFSNNADLSNINLSGCLFNKATVTNMFEGCSNASVINFSGCVFDNEKPTGMFYGYNPNATELTISGCSFVNGSELNQMFTGCSGNLTGISFENCIINSSKMNKMFYGCSNLTSITFDDNCSFTDITSLSETFRGCSGLSEITIKNLSVKAGNNNGISSNIFAGCNSLTDINVPGWKVKDRNEFITLVSSSPSVVNLDASNWTVNNSMTAESAFTVLKKNSLKNVDMSGWTFTGGITTLKNAFNGCGNLNKLNVENWNLSEVKNLDFAFAACSSLTELNLTGWGNGNNLTKVTSMVKTFQGDSSLTSITVGADEVWDLKSVTTMQATFENCKSLNQDMGFLRLSDKLTFMKWTFKNCTSLTELDLSGWNTRNVGGNINEMFNNCSNLTTIYVSDSFVITNTSVGDMFKDCKKLKGEKNTAYANMSDAASSKYAHIDGGEENPGYFTQKQ